MSALEPRIENYRELVESCRRYGPAFRPRNADVWALEQMDETFEVVHAYGLLYHIDQPARALKAFAKRCSGLLLLETCVSFGEELSENIVEEAADNSTQSITGKGCRPTRPWVLNELAALFPHVYVPTIQPSHEEFPTNWQNGPGPNKLARAVFIASRDRLNLRSLRQDLPKTQALQLGQQLSPSDATVDRRNLLERHEITLVLDIGANRGQYAQALRDDHGYRGRLVSFEPGSEAFRKLQLCAANDPLWDCERIAIGDKDGEVSIGLSENSVSSSFLDPTGRALGVEPAIRLVGRESCVVRPLDAVFARYAGTNDKVMVKIDVQGSERQVLAGGGASLRRARLVEMECSAFPVYLGEMLMEEAIDRMRAIGFEVAAIFPGWRHPKTNQALQFDLVFSRND